MKPADSLQANVHQNPWLSRLPLKLHAGDAATMVHACALAADRGVSIGAHPGFDDKPGFGRRVMPLSMEEVEELVASQVGALRTEAASLQFGVVDAM